MTEGAKTPKLRFRKFSGEWQEKKLGYFISDSKLKSTKENEYPVMTSSRRGLILQKDYYGDDNRITDRSNIGYNIIKPGELTYRSRSDDGVFRFNLNITRTTGIVSYFYPVFEITNGNVKFFEEYLNEKWKLLYKYSVGTSQKVLAHTELKRIKMQLPEKLEQEKIAGFLGVVDEKIEQLQKKKCLLEEYKKGVMQKIFSQQVRFKDENGKDYPGWEEKRLGELLDYEQPTKYIVESTEYNNHYQTPVLTAGKTFILGYTDEKNGIYEDNLPVIIFDDFTAASHFVDFRFKVKSSAIKILKAREGVNTKIAYELLRRIKFKADDHKRYWIGTFQDFSLQIPTEEEQQKIADILTTLDDKIKLQESRLEQAKQFKKALLQQMFV